MHTAMHTITQHTTVCDEEPGSEATVCVVMEGFCTVYIMQEREISYFPLTYVISYSLCSTIIVYNFIKLIIIITSAVVNVQL